MREINLNRQLLGLEDLEFGTGTVEQTRAGTKVNITKINAGNLPFDETRTLVEFAQAVNIEELGSSVEAINNLNNDLDKILIVKDNLPIINNVEVIKESIVTLNTNILALQNIDTNMSSINIVKDNLPIINNVEVIKESIVTLDTNILALQNIDTNMSSINIVKDNLPEVVSVAQNIVPNLTEILNVDTLAAQVTQDKSDVSSMKLLVETIYDTFDDRFLGTKIVDPILDNDGNALIDGAMYFNTSSNTMKVYDVGTTTWYSIPQIYLSALLDVNLTSITSGNVLRWNGTKWINYALSKADVGLNLVDNTSDLDKPVSTDTQTALDLKAPLDSAALVNPTINGVAQSGYSGFKNYIINGGFDIWQRGISQTSSGYGSDDRWGNFDNGSTKTHSQITCTDTERALFNASKFSRTVVSRVVGASNFVLKQQAIEDITKLAGKTVTLSFWAKADSSKNIEVRMRQTFGSGGSPSASVNNIGQQLVALTSTWQKKTITITVPSIIGKTLGTDGVHTTALWLRFIFDAGSGYEGSTVGQQSGTFDIAQVQLEEGSIATPFEQRPIGLELNLCRRYLYNIDGAVGMIDTIPSNAVVSLNFGTQMRVPPTTVFYSCSVHEMSIANRTVTGIISTSFSTYGGYLRVTMSSSGTAQNIVNISGALLVEAEL